MAPPPQFSGQDNIEALDRIENLKYTFQDNYFQGTIDLLKFTTPFALAYLAWVIAYYGGAEKNKFLITLTGIFIIISAMIGIWVIWHILERWNLGWESRASHYQLYLKKAGEEISLGQPRDETVDELEKLSAQMRDEGSIEDNLRKDIPMWISLHLIFLSVAVVLSIIQYTNDTLKTIEIIGLIIGFFIVLNWTKISGYFSNS